jgi:hypothetical protein
MGASIFYQNLTVHGHTALNKLEPIKDPNIIMTNYGSRTSLRTSVTKAH